MEFATEPMPKDKRSRNRFYRRDNGHIDFYRHLYEESQRIYAYVGEWHTHPEAVPSYSIIDLKNWKRIGNDAFHDSIQIHLIAGYDALRFWEFSSSTQAITELITIKWTQVILDEKD